MNTGEFKIQCKRLKKYPTMGTIREIQEQGIPLLVCKADHQEKMVAMYWSDFINLLERIYANRS